MFLNTDIIPILLLVATISILPSPLMSPVFTAVTLLQTKRTPGENEIPVPEVFLKTRTPLPVPVSTSGLPSPSTSPAIVPNSS